MIKMIFAMGPNGEFGSTDGLPWDCPKDLAHFKEYTSGCTLLMSPATFNSLPFKLPGRVNVVVGQDGSSCVAKNGDVPDIFMPGKAPLEDVCRKLETYLHQNVCVIGGRKLLDEATSFVDKASITVVRSHLVGKACHYIRPYLFIDELNTRLVLGDLLECNEFTLMEWS